VNTVKHRVMLIDDEAQLNELLKADLEQRGFEVCMESSATHALETAVAFRPDVVVCDISMPGKSGPGVMREFKVHPATRRVPFIFLTALVSTPQECEAPGQPVMLAKPVHVPRLVHHIRECVNPA